MSQWRSFLFALAVAQLAAASCRGTDTSGHADSGARPGDTPGQTTGGDPRDAGGDRARPPASGSYRIAALTSTPQVVGELSDSARCESGWTALYQTLLARGDGSEVHLPIQPAYVNPQAGMYATVADFAEDLTLTYAVLGDHVPVVGISLSWPCVVQSEEIRDEYLELVRTAYGAGFEVELTLLQHDSYPIALHASAGGGLLGGWANPASKSSFLSYVQLVLEVLGPELPKGTLLYLAKEPIPQLLDGYTGQGTYPPGGQNAGRSLAEAFVNQTDAFVSAAGLIREAGLRVGLAPNIRPLTGGLTVNGAGFLDTFHNWAQVDALVTGCLDYNLDGKCEIELEGSLLDVVGPTFYGTMQPQREEDPIELEFADGTQHTMVRRYLEFAPDAARFEEAIAEVQTRYAEQIESGLEVVVGEIGFSDPLAQQVAYLESYLDVADALRVTAIGIHCLTRHAEFAEGNWRFNLIESCDSTACEITNWDQALQRTLEARAAP